MMTGAVFRETDWRSWGRVVNERHRVARPRSPREAAAAFTTAAREPGGVLGVGLGRSYGDSNLNPNGAIVDMSGVDRFIAFDRRAGVMRADAGVSLSEVLTVAVPAGFFLPTTPGSRFVTIGGAIANDVHGKNHHRAGTFGRHVRRLGLFRSDRGFVEISPSIEPELFSATIGGLGLTGLILWAEIALAPVPSAMIAQEVIPFTTLDEFFNLARDSADRFEHTVAWIDCFNRKGRGVFSRADWAKNVEPQLVRPRAGPTIPLDAPSILLNGATIRAFNEVYFRANRWRAGRSTIECDRFFYPLDSIGSWNRLYGVRGFYQYQSVIPFDGAHEATREMLQLIARSGEGSFLAVLKTFGAAPSPGLLSFPMEGVTLALDFPNRGARTLDLMRRLDEVVSAAKGRLYPAKDGRLPPALFRSGYPEFERFRQHVDPACTSLFWRRMIGE